MMRSPHDRASFVHDVIVAAVLITSGAACAQSASSTRSEVAVVHPRLETGSIGPTDPGCPYIARVCALIADPAVRNYIGLSEYAWDFNAPDASPGVEALLPHSPELLIARSNANWAVAIEPPED
jgi:hypothetical protein